MKLAPLYAAMFEKGHRWTYEVTMHGKKRTVTCSVAEVAVLERAIASRIECDDSLFDLDDLGPEGIWLATDDGIGPPPSKRDGMTNRYGTPLYIVMPFKPTVVTEEPSANNVIDKRTAPAKGTWCNVKDDARTKYSPSIRTRCFQDGVGIASGTIVFTDSKRTYAFTRVHTVTPSGPADKSSP